MPKKSGVYYRRKYGKRRKNREEAIIYILAVIALIIFALSISRYLKGGSGKKDVRASLSSVASFQIPYKSFELLYELSTKKNMSFSDTLTIYLIENAFFPDKSAVTPLEGEMNEFLSNFRGIKEAYPAHQVKPYYELIDTLLKEIKYFPIPHGYDEYVYSDSFGAKREYGGERRHEGCDIMDRDNIDGRLPVVSMTDGVIDQIGWNEVGGYRVGVRTENGTYYYYAHLNRFVEGMEKGKKIAAGDALGYMGDTGYSKEEGTRGNFPVHLHVGISPDTSLSSKEFWINPYIFLRFAELTKVVI